MIKMEEIMMKREMILTVMLVVLVFVSAAQGFQLAELSGKVDEVSIEATSGSSASLKSGSSAGSSSSSGSLPSSLQNLPSMVGGC
jgi:hypothetical protein